MAAYIQPGDALLLELMPLRDDVELMVSGEADPISLQAYRLQSISLAGICNQVRSKRSEALNRAFDLHINDEAKLESIYLELLADWLLKHARDTRALMEGGSDDASNAATMSPAALATYRTYARRHEGMIGELCVRHAAMMQERSIEVDPDMVNISATR